MPLDSQILFVLPDGLFMDWKDADGNEHRESPPSFFSNSDTYHDPDDFRNAAEWRETICYNPYNPHFKGDYTAEMMYMISQSCAPIPLSLEEELDEIYRALENPNNGTHWLDAENANS